MSELAKKTMIKSFSFKNLEFVDIEKNKIADECIYKVKAFLLGTSRIPHLYEDKLCYYKFECQASTVKELKKILKKNYKNILYQVELKLSARNLREKRK